MQTDHIENCQIFAKVEELRVAIKSKLKKRDYKKYTVIADPTEGMAQTLGRCDGVTTITFFIIVFLRLIGYWPRFSCIIEIQGCTTFEMTIFEIILENLGAPLFMCLMA